jgi:hypothetical protein
MQPALDGGFGALVVRVVTEWVVVGGGGGGVVAVWVVVVGGGGGGVVAVAVAVAVCVVVVATVAGRAVALWWTCRLALWGAGFGVVAVVALVEVVLVAGALAAAALARWVEVEEDDADPHALTIRVSRTVASGMRSCLMVLPRTPGPPGCFPVAARI